MNFSISIPGLIFIVSKTDKTSSENFEMDCPLTAMLRLSPVLEEMFTLCERRFNDSSNVLPSTFGIGVVLKPRVPVIRLMCQ